MNNIMDNDFFQTLAEKFPQSAVTAFFFLILGSLLTNIFGYFKSILESKDKRIELMNEQKLDLILVSISKLDSKIDNVESSLRAEISNVESSLRAEISKLDSKIDNVESSLRAEISNVESSLRAEISNGNIALKKQGKKTRRDLNGLGYRLQKQLDKHDERISAVEAQIAA
jgi:hypothetical protein